ncbi:MAG: type I secretion C-terminal target domain-containing protein, partial [Alphaproteobacteria bacterium]|nr:type I secretion C-terminal target domain-containing protein [Alphaproteobacteria bacterium]
IATQQQEVFTYHLTDKDGDTDTAELKLLVKPTEAPDDQPEIGDDEKTVDETDGFDTVSGTIQANYGNDGPGEINPNGAFTSSVQNLTSCGHAISVVVGNGSARFPDTNTYYGVDATDKVVFTLEVLENGNYTFTQLGQIDHPDANDPNDVVTLNFGVTAKDADGDTANGTITINVLDDGPDAVNDGRTTDEGKTITGNVTSNDDYGQDGAGAVTQVQHLDAIYIVPATGNVTINAQYGTLTIDSTGTYSYVAKDVNSDGTDKFTYTIADKDGDTDKADLSIFVEGTEEDSEPVLLSATNQVDETGGFDTVSGTVNIDYGNDGPGTMMGTGAFSASDSTLTHCGKPVTVSYNAANGVYKGVADGKTIFTLDTNADGTYTFKQFKQLDHPKGGANHNDVINLNFGVKATDSDGDVGNGTIQIKVYDDGPKATDDNLGSSGGTWVSWGEAIRGSQIGLWNSSFYKNKKPIDNGPLQYSANGLSITDPLDKDYKAVNNFFGGTTYQLKNPGWLGGFGGVSNQTDPNQLYSATVTNIVSFFSGNLITGKHNAAGYNPADGAPDSFGADGAGRLISFSHEGKTYNVPKGGRITIEEGINRITVHSDGSYYILAKTAYTTRHSLEYTIQDKDGDTDTATAKWHTFFVRRGSPLVLDVDGDGVELTNVENGVLFDIDADGDLEQTGWVNGDDVLLVLDKDGNGMITDRSELFGNTDEFTDGFDNLSSYDSNDDGQITAEDDIWGDLQVWKDIDQDGVSDEGELLTLDQIGVVSINLNADMPSGMEINGNLVSHVSSFTTADGETREIVDAWFTYDEIDDAVLTGTSEADNFIFDAIAESAATIRDFDVAEDTIDLSALIEGSDDVTNAINDFVQLHEEDGSTVISVDVDGANGPAEAVEVARLKDVTGTSAEELVNDGTIIV